MGTPFNDQWRLPRQSDAAHPQPRKAWPGEQQRLETGCATVPRDYAVASACAGSPGIQLRHPSLSNQSFGPARRSAGQCQSLRRLLDPCSG